MSRRNTDAITIHSILDWIEDNLESPLSLEKVSERSGYSKWHLQRMFKKETGHSLGQYIRSRKMTEIAQKLKESNEPILLFVTLRKDSCPGNGSSKAFESHLGK
ncbi:helix-turn-helix domain-containing protein [Escherichia coli]|nr:helix-turn-helix domain-containing protein [Escherichia coli]